MARVTHFEIYTDDPEAVRPFYENVFGWKFNKFDGPMDYWLITTGSDKDPGINGGITRPREGQSPGTLNTVAVSSDQAEVDYFWEKLSAGGEKSRCGWLRDKFGLSWQIVPVALMEMVQDENAASTDRVMRALMQMDKLDIATLKRAYEQK
jgi:predicted enzyme related to lactoylglutathione lyase